MSPAMSSKFQQKNPWPINEVYEKNIMFAGLEGGYLNRARSRMADNVVRFNTKKKYKTDGKRQKLIGDAYKWHSIF